MDEVEKAESTVTTAVVDLALVPGDHLGAAGVVNADGVRHGVPRREGTSERSYPPVNPPVEANWS